MRIAQIRDDESMLCEYRMNGRKNRQDASGIVLSHFRCGFSSKSCAAVRSAERNGRDYGDDLGSGAPSDHLY